MWPEPRWIELDELAHIYGDAFYLLDESAVLENYRELLDAFRSRFTNTQIAYSYKTNYTPRICALLRDVGCWAEVVSEMELDLALALGIGPGRIIYNGPHKTHDSLRAAIGADAIINIDSLKEIRRISNAAEGSGKPVSVAIRCNLSLPGTPSSRFGLDVDGHEFQDAVRILRTSDQFELVGLHSHVADRRVPIASLLIDRLLKTCDSIFTDLPPRVINVGGGLFGKMSPELRENLSVPSTNFDDYAQAIASRVASEYGNTPSSPLLVLEPGTALVANAVQFITRVMATKHLNGTQVVVVDGSLFNLGGLGLRSKLPVRTVKRTHSERLPISPPTTITGYTCIEGDYIAENLSDPLVEGDFVEVDNVGSYSVVFKPPFIQPDVPILSRSDPKAQWQCVRRRQTYNDIFGQYSLE